MAAKTILIVEDDQDLVDTLRTVLESAGYEAISAPNGTEGWRKAHEVQPDVAVVDMMMDTVAEGFDLSRKFRSDDKTKSIPIIMVTAINQRFPLGMGQSADDQYLPVDRFLEKPVDPQTLLEQIGELLGG